MLVIFTDLDGTLLDHKSYSCKAAQPALECIRNLGLPLILVTSKTRAEVEVLRTQLAISDPFIVENGGALYVPEDYFSQPVQTPLHRDGYAVIEFGTPYPELVETLHEAAAESQCRVIGFHDLSVEDVSFRCGISMEQALLAKRREYDEPFEILDAWSGPLFAAIEKRKKRWTRGGRFHHITGANDKVHCVRLLSHFFHRVFNGVTTVGLGDSFNDARFLKTVDVPVVLQSADSAKLHAMIRRARLSDRPGPEGWNQEVLEILKIHSTRQKSQNQR